MNTKPATEKIEYGIAQSPFGAAFIAISKKGISHLSFLGKSEKASLKQILAELKKNWPKADLHENKKLAQKYIQQIFSNKKPAKKLPLEIQGTQFQQKVWKTLLTIPKGKTVSYTELAKLAGEPKAVRAVGTACGKNSIAFLIPCHRVLAANGKIGGYRWGTDIKKKILAWEAIS